jgi:hypothetical protein
MALDFPCAMRYTYYPGVLHSLSYQAGEIIDNCFYRNRNFGVGCNFCQRLDGRSERYRHRSFNPRFTSAHRDYNGGYT